MAKGKKKRYTARERKAFWFGFARGQSVDSYLNSFESMSKKEKESCNAGYVAASENRKKNPFKARSKKGN